MAIAGDDDEDVLTEVELIDKQKSNVAGKKARELRVWSLLQFGKIL